MAGQGSIVCVLYIEDDVVCYFCHCLQTVDIKHSLLAKVDIKQTAIEPVLDAKAICGRDVVTKDKSHSYKGEVENNRC